MSASDRRPVEGGTLPYVVRVFLRSPRHPNPPCRPPMMVRPGKIRRLLDAAFGAAWTIAAGRSMVGCGVNGNIWVVGELRLLNEKHNINVFCLCVLYKGWVCGSAVAIAFTLHAGVVEQKRARGLEKGYIQP